MYVTHEEKRRRPRCDRNRPRSIRTGRHRAGRSCSHMWGSRIRSEGALHTARSSRTTIKNGPIGPFTLLHEIGVASRSAQNR
ncbi:hypothetical protein C6T61_29825 [Burkholderia multivorans]|nr:hypothetical protein C6T61_29825 [Burkholderia multivorans]